MVTWNKSNRFRLSSTWCARLAGVTDVTLMSNGVNLRVSSSFQMRKERVCFPATCVLLQGIFDGDEVLQRLGHLAAGDGEVPSVQEVPHPVVVLKESLWETQTVVKRLSSSPPSALLINLLLSHTSDWANSLSWWGKRRSNPPPWMSMDSPRMEPAMAEHSICQPGLPWNEEERPSTIAPPTSCSVTV